MGNISAVSAGRVKGTANNGKKEKKVVVGAVEDMSGKTKADATELSGEKAEENATELSGARAGENTLRVFGEKTEKGAARDFEVEAWADEARTVRREKGLLEATMSQVSGAEGQDTDVWAKQAEASTAEAGALSIGAIMKMKSIRPATTNTNQTLIGTGSSVKHLRI